jgi:hypothetical protein
MSYESQATEIYEHFFNITKDAKQAKECAVYMVTNLMRHSNDSLFYAKILLKLEEIIL